MAGDMTTQPKEGRQAAPMSCLSIHSCLWLTSRTTGFFF
jgi:hypothetical protein